jgi:hypothetical protein
VNCRYLLPIYSLGRLVEISIGTPKGRVPWAEIQRAQGDYIKQKYLPEEVTLRQYYHLRRKDVDAILEHWAKRQAAGKLPFRFKKAAKAILQNKRASKANDVTTDMEPGEAAEEDLQGGGDCQAWGDEVSQGDGGSNGSTEQARPGQSLGDATENASRVGWLMEHCNSMR